ncbi:unnamed protein product [Caenorhabditis brenneri]
MKWKAFFCLMLLLFAFACCESEPDDNPEEENSPQEEEQQEEESDDGQPYQAAQEDNPNDDGNGGSEPLEELTTLPTTTPTSTIPTTTLDYCHCDMEVYGLTDLEGVLKSPNYPGAHCDSGKCIYKILPHPDMSVKLNVETAQFSSGTLLKIWTIVNVDGNEYNVFHSEYGSYRYTDFDGYDLFTTAKNVGIKIIFHMQKNSYASSGFKISFERLSGATSTELCPPAHVIVGSQKVVVSQSKSFSIQSGCSFFLTPAKDPKYGQLGEMIIDIGNIDTTYVSIRSYDEEGRFARDLYMSENRTKIVDSSRVEISFRRRAASDRDYMTPTIVVRNVYQGCQCPPPVMNLTLENAVLMESPGFPAEYCPSKHCLVNVYAQVEKMSSASLVPLIFITTDYSIGGDDFLKLSSLETGRTIFRTVRHSHRHNFVFRPLMTDVQNLQLEYGSSSKRQLRYFEMNITIFVAEKRCVCSLHSSKDYTNGGSMSIEIPRDCPVLHCHWKFSSKNDYPPKYVSVEFQMASPTEHDAVYIFSDKLTQEFESEYLSRKTSITSSVSPVTFTFSRFHDNKTIEVDSVLNVTWKFIEPCECDPDQYSVKLGETVAITSPHFPEEYCPNLVCRHTFYAPEGCYLEFRLHYADIEKYHDFLNIYDGNRTVDPLMARITGKVRNITSYNSTNQAIFVTFITDASNSNQGYLANVIAHEKEKNETPAGNDWLIFIGIAIVIVLVVAVGVAIVYILKKKQAAETEHPKRKPKKEVLTVNNPNSSDNSFDTNAENDIPLEDRLLD